MPRFVSEFDAAFAFVWLLPVYILLHFVFIIF